MPISVVGEHLKKIRILSNLTQEQLSALTNRERTTFSKIENGGIDVKVEHIKLYITGSILHAVKSGVLKPEVSHQIELLIDVISSMESNDSSSEFVHSHLGVRWTQNIPTHVSERTKKVIANGINIYRKLFLEHMPLYVLEKEMTENGIRTYQEMYYCLITAFRLGALELIDVPRNNQLEQLLDEKYGIDPDNRLIFIVADVPNCDGTPLRAEFVASLAAKEIFGKTDFDLSGTFGLSAGYLIYRTLHGAMKYQSCKDVNWLALMSTKQQSMKYTANYLVEMMANRHYGSSVTRLSFHDSAGISNSENFARNMKMALISATGAGRRTRKGSPNGSGVFIEDDYKNIIPVRQIYEKLIEKDRKLDVAGEILGLMVDDNLQPFEEIKDLQKEIIRQLGFDYLRSARRGGRVWMIASQHFRFRPVLAAIKGNLANGFIIDKEIAECLLHPEESLEELKEELKKTVY